MCAERLRACVFRFRRGKYGWAVPLLLVLAIVIVAALAFNLANLDTGGESIPQVPAPGGPASRSGVFFPDPIATVILTILFAFLIVGTAILLFRRRARANLPRKALTWWEVLARGLGLALVVAILVVWPRAIQAARSRAGTETNTTAVDAGTFTTVWPAVAGWPIELFLIVAIFAAVVSFLFLLRRGGRVPPDSHDAFPVPGAQQAAAVAVQETIHELEGGGDVRTAILGCFQRFCTLLGSRGITDQVALTPRELEGLAIDQIKVSRDAAGILTSLFEEARYSEHPLGEAERVRAIHTLGRIQAALEA